MPTARAYLEAYDRQLRTDAETRGATAVARIGPLWLATFPGGRGFVTYRDLGDADAPAIARWVKAALDHYRADPGVTSVEWKSRGHDRAPGLHEALLANGFVQEEAESIMIGEAATLVASDAPLPAGVVLRPVTSESDVRALARMQEEVFGGRFADGMVEELLPRLGSGDGVELWVAEAGGEIVSSGRLEPVDGTEFAGIWGGATRPGWRRQGIYRALTAARARSAIARGKRLIHSDSTEGSRPILERAGLVKVSATTPYEWRAAGGHSA
jgi:hypothetical protein